MLTGKVVVIPDILEDKDYAHPANELNRTRSMLAVPLLRNDRVEGVLVIAQTEPGARCYSSRLGEELAPESRETSFIDNSPHPFDPSISRPTELHQFDTNSRSRSNSGLYRIFGRDRFALGVSFSR